MNQMPLDFYQFSEGLASREVEMGQPFSSMNFQQIQAFPDQQQLELFKKSYSQMSRFFAPEQNNRLTQHLPTLMSASINQDQAIKKVETHTTNITRVKQKQVSDGLLCNVCLDEYKIRDIVSHLPCQHFFHVKCIYTWLRKVKTSPCCRSIVPIKLSATD